LHNKTRKALNKWHIPTKAPNMPYINYLEVQDGNQPSKYHRNSTNSCNINNLREKFWAIGVLPP